ncbi:hypothetical protein ACS0TY_004368 [Phlomoides rotata]
MLLNHGISSTVYVDVDAIEYRKIQKFVNLHGDSKRLKGRFGVLTLICLMPTFQVHHYIMVFNLPRKCDVIVGINYECAHQRRITTLVVDYLIPCSRDQKCRCDRFGIELASSRMKIKHLILCICNFQMINVFINLTPINAMNTPCMIIHTQLKVDKTHLDAYISIKYTLKDKSLGDAP